MGPARIVGRPKGTRLTSFDPMRDHKCLRFKDRISPYIERRKLPDFINTKASKFYPFLNPLFCSVGSGRQHYIYIALNIRVCL